METRDDRVGRLLEYSFAGPAEHMLSEYALGGLRVRIAPQWWRRAACEGCDTDAWYPESQSKPNPLVARICAGCPVRKSCLATAILADEDGIWGGTRRGQRLHGRARLLADHHPGDVIADLLAAPSADTEYHLPDPQLPAAEPTPLPVSVDAEEWDEAS
jgi:transcription factor WhiB